MIEIIDFVIQNAEAIVSYEVVDYHLDGYVVEFIMTNGEKVQICF